MNNSTDAHQDVHKPDGISHPSWTVNCICAILSILNCEKSNYRN